MRKSEVKKLKVSKSFAFFIVKAMKGCKGITCGIKKKIGAKSKEFQKFISKHRDCWQIRPFFLKKIAEINGKAKNF